MAETRWWRWPDVDGLTSAHRAANQAARQARAAATARRASVTESARALIEAADAAVAASEAWAARIHLGGGRRLLLARARSAVLEARVYERAGDPGSATVRARQATDLAGQVRDHAAEVAARYADGDTLARWQRWKADTIAWSRREGRAAIVVAKEDHTLTVYLRGEPVRAYKVDLGFNWIADKSHAGDGATPEGRYRVVSRKVNGASIYYKALLLDYPNAEDRAEFSRARRAGTVPNAVGIGSLIEIHGEGGRGRDWTKGCVALTNPDIDDLMTRVGIGTPVTIVGSDNYGAIAEFASQQRRSPADRQP
jgi:lipoprotein-anchoring transpeptidase ErfK/SrfK